ncbi:MAG: NAD(P)-dependent oxidoreductase [Candidatus Omnitrophota bacterium]
MKTCLVTGATGLIGSEFLKLLHADEWTTCALTRKPVKFPLADAKAIVCDLSREWNRDNFPKKTDVVIHLAQSGRFRDFPNGAEDLFNVNTRSTASLLDYAYRAKANTFILASSGGIYSNDGKLLTENSELIADGKSGFYAGTKFCSEIIADNYTEYMNVIILRFFFVYGPSQNRGMLMPRLIDSVKNGKPINLNGPDGISVNPTYVSDAADALFAAMSLKGSDKINVAGPEALTMRQIGETIGEIMGKKPIFEMHKESGPSSLIGDINKMGRLLVKPKVLLRDGLKIMLGENEKK